VEDSERLLAVMRTSPDGLTSPFEIHGFRFRPVTDRHRDDSLLSAAEALARAAAGPLPAGPPYEHYVTLVRVDLDADVPDEVGVDTEGRLCWAIVTTGYETGRSGPYGSPLPTLAEGTSLVCIEASTGEPVGGLGTEWGRFIKDAQPPTA
jgi:hypothetical protein